MIDSISEETVWKKHSLAQPILGNEDVIKNINLEEIINYKKEIFCKENIALVITGAIENEQIQLISKELEQIKINSNKKRNIDNAVEVQFKRKPDITLVNYAWGPIDVQLSFDVDLKLISENELIFLNSIIGGGDGSILPKEIRGKLGLVYDIHSDVEIFKGMAVLSIFFSIDKKCLYTGLEKIVDILKNLKFNISQTDVDMNMIFFTENLWYWTEDSHELNFQLGWDFVKGKELLTIEERIEANKSISYSRMREVADILFRTKNMSFIGMGTTNGITKRALKEILVLG